MTDLTTSYNSFGEVGGKGQQQQKMEQLCCIEMSRLVHAAWKQMMQA